MDEFQARADVDELKRLCEAAQRPKVADILTIEIRRLETKLSDLVKKSEAEASKATAGDRLQQQPIPLHTHAGGRHTCCKADGPAAAGACLF